MKFLRYYYNEQVYYGKLEENKIYPLVSNTIWNENLEFAKETLSLKDVKILTPSVPNKIVAVGLNYIDHAKEMNLAVPDEPVLFLKPFTSILEPDEKIEYPQQSKQVDYEAELAVIIKKQAKNIKRENFKDYILGYTCFNDVTARDLQKKDGQWTRAKSFDTFSPFGPVCVTPDEVEPDDLKIEAILNGEVKQSSRTSNLIFKIDYLVEFISNVMTLLPGDVITTGTPPGIGPMQKGDTIDIKIENIGILRNHI